MRHHPAILRVQPRARVVPQGHFLEFGGAVTPAEWTNAEWRRQREVRVQKAEAVIEPPPAPPVNEEYFEWIDLLEAIDTARDHFVMIELGAGYGRWSVHGALAARAAGLEPHCVAVEAEPTHARWLRQHFLDNGLPPADHELLWAAIGREAGFVPFATGHARTCYSREVVKRTDAPFPTAAERRTLRARSVLGRPPRVSDERTGSMWVPALGLNEVLAPYRMVDLLDLDIQGAELVVLSAAIGRLNARVRRAHVGTHGAVPGVEDGLRELFTKHGWSCQHDYATGAVVDTPYGQVEFADGVQSWINNDCGRPEPDPTALDEGERAMLQDQVLRLKQRIGAMKAKASKRG